MARMSAPSRVRAPGLAHLDAVLFDAGGTLVELDYAFITARAAEHGVSLRPEALRRGEAVSRRQIDRGARKAGRVVGTDAARRFRYFASLLEATGVPAKRAERICDALEDDHARDSLWRVAIEGAVETLEALRARGLETAVVSNADGRVASILENAGLAAHLTLIVDSHLEGVEKPDPAIFRLALSRLGIDAGRAAYVGDIYSIDALGARAAGLTPVLLDLTGGYADVDCATIASLRELLGEAPA